MIIELDYPLLETASRGLQWSRMIKIPKLRVVEAKGEWVRGRRVYKLSVYFHGPKKIGAVQVNYYCQANVNAVKRIWAPKLQLFSNSYQLRHCLRGGISQEVGTPRYLSLVVPLTKVGDEAVHKELGDRMERAATTASSLEAEQDSGSGPRCQDTILGDVNAQTRLKLVLSVLVSAVKRMLMLLVQVSAIEVNPVIYTFCIEQFCATAKVQTVNGVRQLQALVDKKRVIVTESSIRRYLHLDDAEGTDCLPTATIFKELARKGYEKPSQKLTFYKAFFSPQWKYYIHTITECLSSKSTV
ncbi:hypothetical protein Tco_0744074 [Tanacetum coccineum]